MRVRLTLAAVLAAALVTVTGCHSDMTATAARPNVPAALDFRGTTLTGKTFDGASLAGRPAVLWFWAPWCATCAGEAGRVAWLATKYQGRVDVLGVAGMGPEADMHRFVTEQQIGNVTSLSDNAGKVWRRFGITQQSLYVLLNAKGQVVTKGFLDDLAIQQAVARLAAV
jgi:thiol-disulfide isomerase/thioredoxin